jgi:hypothetical protein
LEEVEEGRACLELDKGPGPEGGDTREDEDVSESEPDMVSLGEGGGGWEGRDGRERWKGEREG